MTDTARGGQVRSVAKAMELLEALLRRRAPMSLHELSAAVGYPRSTVHALLSTLREHGMVAQGADGRYALGLRLFECGCAVSAQWDVTKTALPFLEQLSERSGASAFLSVLEDEHVITLERRIGGTGPQVVPEVGARLPLHATSQGKLLTAFLSAAEARKRLTAAGMPPFTPHTVTDVNALLRELDEARSRGYAVEDGEYKIGLRSVSAPVRRGVGEVRWAVGVVGLFRRVNSDEFARAVQETALTAQQLSAALGREL